MSYTRAQVRDLIRQRCGIEYTTAQTDSELNNRINEAAVYTHEFNLGVYGENYAIGSTTVTTASGTSSYAISPSDFMSPLAVRLVFDDRSYPLLSFSVSDIISTTSGTAWGAGSLPKYNVFRQLDGTFYINFDPTPDGVYTVYITYHVAAPEYTSDSDSVTIPNVDLLVVEACRRVKMKEQRDPSEFIAERAAIQKRVEDWVGAIDDGQPARTQTPRYRYRNYRDRVF